MAEDGLCLFGGSFNPPHKTHRRIAATALDRLAAARLLVLPCREHPHKHNLDLAPAEHRLQMCRLDFEGLDRIEVSDREIQRPGPSYTVDTLCELRAELGAATPLYWIIGSDNLPLIPTWHRYREIFALATVCTFPRLGCPIDEAALQGTGLEPAEIGHLLNSALDLQPDAISSSEIRTALGRGEDVPEILPAVAEYIRRHGLYTGGGTGAG